MMRGAIAVPGALAPGRAPIFDSRRLGRFALLSAALLGYAVILTPILFVCWLSFFSNEIVTFPPQGYTVRWFAHIFDQNNFVSGFVTSLQVGIAAMIGGLILGIRAANSPAARPSTRCCFCHSWFRASWPARRSTYSRSRSSSRAAGRSWAHAPDSSWPTS